MPLLSVVIPTLDRPDTLRHSLATLSNQSGADCEFVVQNNGGNAKIAALVEDLADPRFKHFATPRVVTMTENWEQALDHATGEYVTFIGDDDGLMPGACDIATTILTKGDIALLSWAPYAYYWPDYYHADFRNRLVAEIDFRFYLERVASREELTLVYNFQASYSRLPMIYNSFVRRDVIERMKSIANRYFLGLAPDLTSGIANAALTKDFLRLSRPLSMSGLSGHSTGHTTFFRESSTIGSVNTQRDFGDIGKIPQLPNVDSLQLFLAQDMLTLKRELFPADPTITLNYKGLAQAIARDINDRPEIYDKTRQSIYELAAVHDFNPAEIIVPARSDGRPPLGIGVDVTGKLRVQFKLNGAELGLRSIADAVRVIGNFIPAPEALDMTTPPVEQPQPVLGLRGIDFTRDGQGAAALIKGWGQPEAWGTWSVAKTCSLRLILDPVPTRPVLLSLKCRGFVSAENPHLQVSCRVGSGAAQAWGFSMTAFAGVRNIIVEPSAIDSKGEIMIDFVLTEPRSPADQHLGDDTRPLGIGIERMWIID